jgi:uncharacterized membrane protein YhaH (DUF805 family)
MDPQQQQQLAGAMAGMVGIFALIGFAIVAFAIFLFWRILGKAGLSGPLALLILIPGIGWLIVICILAFSDWRVVPVTTTPYFPPPPVYPPSSSTGTL